MVAIQLNDPGPLDLAQLRMVVRWQHMDIDHRTFRFYARNRLGLHRGSAGLGPEVHFGTACRHTSPKYPRALSCTQEHKGYAGTIDFITVGVWRAYLCRYL